MRETFHALRTGKRLNVQLYTFVKRFITPVVLLAGLLILAIFHFKGVLAVTTSQSNLYRGVTAYSSGSYAITFQNNAGTDRPAIIYNGVNLLSYVDWSSTISVDGEVQNLWDNFHGYSTDDTKHQIFATTSGYGWQVVEVVTLVDSHTVTVQYSFMAAHQGTAEPHHVVLSITHLHRTWLDPTVQGTTFTAEVLPGHVSAISSATSIPHAVGTVTVTVNGPAVDTTSAISIDDLQSFAVSDSTEQFLASSMTTRYVVDNPQVDRLIPLGTETVTFSSTVPTGTAFPAPVATP
ncbi:MAG TPA: hypothetical protein VKQ30_15410 [Ktedonobacterales bacterium]|nr:hypothetical protein [Ktedonobacterales bacterium]